MAEHGVRIQQAGAVPGEQAPMMAMLEHPGNLGLVMAAAVENLTAQAVVMAASHLEAAAVGGD